MEVIEKCADDIVARAKLFCNDHLQPIARELDKQSRFPVELLEMIAQEGFLGMNYPVSYGGGGYDSVTAHQAVKEFAKVSAGVALTFHVHWMAIDVLLQFGSAEQKQKYLPDLIQGRKIAAYTISEAQAGSDAAGIRSLAVPAEGGWLLNGAKYFCTNGGLADIYIVAFKTDAEAGAKGIGLFIIEKGAAGFQIGPAEEKMGCRSSQTTSLVFHNCLVPPDRLLGNGKDGFKIAMYGLTGGRLGMAVMGLGIAEAALETAARYANRRIAFGKPLSALYAVQEMLAEMHVKIEAAKLLVDDTARQRDSGSDYAVATSVAKLFVAEVTSEVCHKAMQILGGHGYMKYNVVERYVRDARLMDIGVGASEVLKMVVGSTVAKTIGSDNE
ncbi:acyl-CoA dehydrogenase family protein [Anaerospora hongkongensis]|uniref:acyl-CoA dehydrogenase family protein n=2 Tax=Anaerospora hongkongensis TaxID=244830 RepID=UPI002896C19D|nr:acyl-CoA dehydrogenase family protein [Anaerospora hongkongensis]